MTETDFIIALLEDAKKDEKKITRIEKALEWGGGSFPVQPAISIFKHLLDFLDIPKESEKYDPDGYVRDKWFDLYDNFIAGIISAENLIARIRKEGLKYARKNKKILKLPGIS